MCIPSQAVPLIGTNTMDNGVFFDVADGNMTCKIGSTTIPVTFDGRYHVEVILNPDWPDTTQSCIPFVRSANSMYVDPDGPIVSAARVDPDDALQSFAVQSPPPMERMADEIPRYLQSTHMQQMETPTVLVEDKTKSPKT